MGENQLLVDTDILIAYLNHKAYRAYLENPKNRIYYSAITKKELLWTAPLQLESFHRDLRGARPVVLGF